jgi:hypothetical protein
MVHVLPCGRAALCTRGEESAVGVGRVIRLHKGRLCDSSARADSTPTQPDSTRRAFGKGAGVVLRGRSLTCVAHGFTCV